MTEKLRQAGDLASEYVTYGAMRSDQQFDDLFSQLAAIVPERCRRTPLTAWRVMTVSGSEYRQLQAGLNISLRPRAFGSWTKDKSAARLLLRGRCAIANGDDMTLVVRKDLAPDACVVDIEALYQKLKWDSSDVDEWDRYVHWEREVILKNDAYLLTIRPVEIVSAHAAGDLHALRPYPDERAWSPAAEDFFEIDSVADEQPFAADGVWLVENHDGELAVKWDARNSCWESTTTPTCAISPK